jgi:Domain of unknown function (DUF4442)
MFDLNTIVNKAYDSPFYLWLLNQLASFMIPFNRPHRIRIASLSQEKIVIKCPLIRKNKNHLNGMHACALATISEYTTGFLLISNLDPKQYRLILKSLNMQYLYQAKSAVHGHYELDPTAIIKQVANDVELGVPTLITCTIALFDNENNKVSEGEILWQIKPWKAVKSKV